MSRLWASLLRMLDRTPGPPAPKVSHSPDWRQCEDSARMLTLLGVNGHSRKARLLACACARRLLDSLSDPCRRVVESLEWMVEHEESGQLPVPGEYTEDGFLILLRESPDAIRGELLAMMECLFWYDRAMAEEVPP